MVLRAVQVQFNYLVREGFESNYANILVNGCACNLPAVACAEHLGPRARVSGETKYRWLYVCYRCGVSSAAGMKTQSDSSAGASDEAAAGVHPPVPGAGQAEPSDGRPRRSGCCYRRECRRGGSRG